MKKIFFTLLLSILALTSHAQNDGLYVDGMKWVCGGFTFAKKDSVGDVEKILYTYIIKGDTVVNGTEYKKMFQLFSYPNDDYEYLGDMMCLCRYDDGKYLFYLPEMKNRWGDEYFIGDDYVFFDENLGKGEILSSAGKIDCIKDTAFDDFYNVIRKYWKMELDRGASLRYEYALDNVLWVEGIGSLSQPMPYQIDALDCTCYQMVLYCINPAGDTIYRNQKYIDFVEPYFKTNIPALKSDNVSFKQQDGKCIVTLPYDASAWSATLYNSVSVTVSRRSGEGSEIILPATSKGTHILVVNADGRVVKKKVYIK